tara:strand:- start:5329 stop:6009 length:681 start_codon:yes stop_codon:yes gene_type:complete
MKKFYKVLLLLLTFTFLSTYNPKDFNISEKNNEFFKIKNIKITNTNLIKKEDIYSKLDHIYNKNIFLLKKKDIEEPLQGINFLEKIEVKKKYPNSILVKIFETKPLAILFKNKIKYIIDSSSNLNSFDQNNNIYQLPKVFGEGAEGNFLHFINKLKKNNFPLEHIKNFYYFQIGRWDLELIDNKTIKFPHTKIDDTIRKSVELLNRKDFKNYKIIDLRVVGKIIVE